MNKILEFLRREDGPTIAEYAVLLALLVGMMVASLTYVGDEIQALSETNSEGLSNALDD